VLEEDRLDALENFGGLDGVSAGTHLEINVGRRNAHLAKENVGESGVVVLARVNEDRINFRMALHFAHQRRDLWQIGTGAYYVDNFQSFAHELVKVSEIRV